jgi:hypothetical protein
MVKPHGGSLAASHLFQPREGCSARRRARCFSVSTAPAGPSLQAFPQEPGTPRARGDLRGPTGPVVGHLSRPRRLHAPLFHQAGNSGGEILLRAAGRPASATRWLRSDRPASCRFGLPREPVSPSASRWAARAGPERHDRERRGPSAGDGPLLLAGEGEGRPRRPAKPAPPSNRVRPRDADVNPQLSLAPRPLPIPSWVPIGRAKRSSCFGNDAEAFPRAVPPFHLDRPLGNMLSRVQCGAIIAAM